VASLLALSNQNAKEEVPAKRSKIVTSATVKQTVQVPSVHIVLRYTDSQMHNRVIVNGVFHSKQAALDYANTITLSNGEKEEEEEAVTFPPGFVVAYGNVIYQANAVPVDRVIGENWRVAVTLAPLLG
jgi:hypothetical protein